MSSSNGQKKDRKQYIFNLTMAAVAGQVGCLTMVIILAAVFGGLWLDSQFNTRPMITLILVFGSLPLTLILMFFIVRSATKKIEQNSTEKIGNDTQKKEEDHFE